MDGKNKAPASRYQPKLEALKKAAREEGLGSVILYSSGQLSMLEVNPVLWISGYLPMGAHSLVLVTEKRDPALFLSLPWDVGRARRQSWMQDVQAPSDMAEASHAWLASAGVADKPAGLIGGDFMPAILYDRLARVASVGIKKADGLLSALVKFPDQEDRECLREAGRLADLGFQAILKHARVGMRESDLAAEMEYAMRSRGAEDNFGMVSASDHSHGVHPPGDRKLKPGDIIIAEITPCLGGHFVQLCRTATLGPASDLVKEKFAVLEEALNRSLAVTKPGHRAGEIAVAMNQVFGNAGYAEYCRPPYMRVRGHGLGYRTMPFEEIVEENQSEIKPGMVFVVHPNQYIPETGYLLLGDTVQITDSGHELLTKTEPKLFSIEI